MAIAEEMHIDRILILDFGSQYSHLIVRRCREIGVYAELMRCDTNIDDIRNFSAKGIILSGGPYSVYEEEAPHCVPAFWQYVDQTHMPLLGICYGLQEMTYALKGKVSASAKREYGHAELMMKELNAEERKLDNQANHSPAVNGVPTAPRDSEPDPNQVHDNPTAVSPNVHRLFQGLVHNPTRVWMSHGDKVTQLAPGFQAIAVTPSSEYACVAHLEKQMFGLQFHPEVTHTDEGTQLIRNFILKICGAVPSWNMKNFAHTEMERLRRQIGERHVLGALSGGVDSTVAAALLHKAIGHKFHGVLIDTGLLRMHEGPEVIQRLKQHIPGLQVDCIDATQEFFDALKGVTDPEKKRKIIGGLFIECFEKATKELHLPVEGGFLLQGTLYPDVIESISFKGPSATIKTHHNVGGLPAKMKLQVLEPLRELFKDEVRALGMELGIDRSSVWRHPFPGPGLAIRILGEITRERADILRQADDIFLDEIRKSGDYDKIGQAFVVLLPDVKSVGVMGDSRTYEMACCIRAVATSDFMTADWYHMPYDVLARCSSRIINEVTGINRVCYDISSKPPATIEWE